MSPVTSSRQQQPLILSQWLTRHLRQAINILFFLPFRLFFLLSCFRPIYHSPFLSNIKSFQFLFVLLENSDIPQKHFEKITYRLTLWFSNYIQNHFSLDTHIWTIFCFICYAFSSNFYLSLTKWLQSLIVSTTKFIFLFMVFSFFIT